MIKKSKKGLDDKMLAFLALSTVYGLRREEMAKLRKGELSGDTLTVETLKRGPTTRQIIPVEIKKYLRGCEPDDI